LGGSSVSILLAALAGGLAALAGREALLAAPALRRWLATAVEPMRRAGREGYEPTEVEQRRLAVLVAAALLASGLLVAGPGPLAVVALAGPAVAASTIARRRSRYRLAVERHLPEIATAVADALAAGRSVRGALAAASASLDGQPAVELGRVGADLDLGAPTADALSGMRARIRSPRIDAFAAALVSQQASGGDLVALLRRFALASAERDRAARDARAATAQARFTGLLVVAMPTGAALFAELVEPGFLGHLMSEPGGAAILTVAAGLQIVGFAAIRRLARPVA
jgi:tight adherence protein B